MALLEKLDRSLIQIAAFGLVGRGKSSILNALVGQEIFTTGPLHGVTRTIKGVNWQLSSDDTFPNLARLTLNGQGNAQVQLLDTPGIDEVDGQTREILACQVAQQVDLILFIISGDMTKVEFSALAKLREAGKPMILVFNKIDQYPEVDRLAIYEKICPGVEPSAQRTTIPSSLEVSPGHDSGRSQGKISICFEVKFTANLPI